MVLQPGRRGGGGWLFLARGRGSGRPPGDPPAEVVAVCCFFSGGGVVRVWLSLLLCFFFGGGGGGVRAWWGLITFGGEYTPQKKWDGLIRPWSALICFCRWPRLLEESPFGGYGSRRGATVQQIPPSKSCGFLTKSGSQPAKRGLFLMSWSLRK